MLAFKPKPNFLCNFATVFMNYNAYFCGYIEKNVYSGFLLACSPWIMSCMNVYLSTLQEQFSDCFKNILQPRAHLFWCAITLQI